jgi:hypothetical protein
VDDGDGVLVAEEVADGVAVDETLWWEEGLEVAVEIVDPEALAVLVDETVPVAEALAVGEDDAVTVEVGDGEGEGNGVVVDDMLDEGEGAGDVEPVPVDDMELVALLMGLPLTEADGVRVDVCEAVRDEVGLGDVDADADAVAEGEGNMGHETDHSFLSQLP